MADSEQRGSDVGPKSKARRDEEPKSPGDDAPQRADVPQPGTVGGLLKQARIAQDLSVEQLAAELRIEAQQLVALEQDRFERIGVPVFVKGYIKQYGTRLGLDTSDLLAAYYKQGKLEDIDIRPSRSIPLRDPQGTRGWLVALLVLLVILAALAAWWLSGEGFGGIVLPTERSEPAASPAAGLPTPPARAQDAASAAVERVEVEVPRPAAESAAQPTPGAEQPGPPPAAGGTVSQPSDAAAEPQASSRTQAALRPLGLAVDVDVLFEQQSWAEITDARGERLYYGLGSAGKRATLRGEPPIAVVLGNVDGVRIKVEGADYEIPRPKQGNYARFSLQVAEQ